MPQKTVALAADHAGFALKSHLVDWLSGRGIAARDLGTDSADSVDYPDFAGLLVDVLRSDGAGYGVLICGSGIGMSIAANKVPGARAALVHTVEGARLCREHNDANILALAGETLAPDDAGAVVAAFLDAPFAGGRHRRRVDKIIAMERQAERREPSSASTPA